MALANLFKASPQMLHLTMVTDRGEQLDLGLLAEIGSLAGDDGEASYKAQASTTASGDLRV
jgi:hypothetical protein